MNNTTKKLYDEMIQDIREFSEMGIPAINRLGGALRTMRDILLRLRSQVVSSGFKDNAEEIAFFKYDKPKFVAEQIYLTELTVMLVGRPGNEAEILKVYYEEELRRIHNFIGRFGFLYQCFVLDAGDLDEVLFLRDAGTSGLALPVESLADPEFSTNGDHLWAKFIAFDRLREWLTTEIRGLEGESAEPSAGTQDDGGVWPLLKWTGNSVNLAELAYGLWLTGQINNGHVSVSEIVTWLERHFGVKIGDAHRRWQSIAARKRVGPFVYIDEMKAALVKRLEEEWGGERYPEHNYLE
jgi:hypothetical protein